MKLKNYPTEPTHEEIGARSRHLWSVAGQPTNRDLEFWLAAETEVRCEAEETRKTIDEDSKLATP